MEHYFIDKEHSESDYFEFEEVFNSKHFIFKSCDDIFSKDRLDYGTKVLMDAIIKKVELNGNCLDIGCGYGTIGIILSKFFDNVNFTMCDINNTAVKLSKENVNRNKVESINDIFYSDGYENVKNSFDYVITNPPIKAGKENLLKILKGAYNVLNEGGSLIFVIKKKHGEESVKKELETLFNNVEIIKRDSGYYILKCDK